MEPTTGTQSNSGMKAHNGMGAGVHTALQEEKENATPSQHRQHRGLKSTAAACHRAQELHGASNQAGQKPPSAKSNQRKARGGKGKPGSIRARARVAQVVKGRASASEASSQCCAALHKPGAWPTGKAGGKQAAGGQRRHDGRPQSSKARLLQPGEERYKQQCGPSSRSASQKPCPELIYSFTYYWEARAEG